MSDAVIIALMVAVPPTLVALASVIATIRGNREAQTALKEIHLTMNSRLDQLLESTSKLAKEKGVSEGIAQEKSRNKTEDK